MFNNLLAFKHKNQGEEVELKTVAQSPPAVSTTPEPEDPWKELSRKAEEHGNTVARNSKDVIPNKIRMDKLEDYAEGMVDTLVRSPFNPALYPADRELQDKLVALKEEEERLRNEEIHAETALYDASIKLPSAEARPQLPLLLFIFAITAFGFGLGSSIQPLFAQTLIEDPEMCWVASLTLGGCIGGLVIYCLFDIQD